MAGIEKNAMTVARLARRHKGEEWKYERANEDWWRARGYRAVELLPHGYGQGLSRKGDQSEQQNKLSLPGQNKFS